MPVHLRVHWVRVGESAKLALCFIHLTSNAYAPCVSLPLPATPSITREEFSGIAEQLKGHFEGHLGPQQELFPKHLFQMVSLGPEGALGMGLIWPPDTAERNDSEIFLGVFRCLQEYLPLNCWTLNVVHDVWLGIGECRSTVIKFGEFFFPCMGLFPNSDLDYRRYSFCVSREDLRCAENSSGSQRSLELNIAG